MNLSEAFKQLDCLNEDVFQVSDKGLEELKDFRDSDDSDDTIEVIDPEAENKEEIKDSYVGKIICQCNVCKSLVYFDKDNIQIDEEIKIFIVVIIHYCSKRIENEDIIFHTNDIAIIEKEQLHLSSNKVLIQISKSNNTIYIGNSYEIEINRISSIKYYPVLNKISLYDDNNNKEFTLFFFLQYSII